MRSLLLALVITLICGSSAFAQVAAPAAPAAATNTVCPLDGAAVDTKATAVVVGDVSIAVCCDKCGKKIAHWVEDKDDAADQKKLADIVAAAKANKSVAPAAAAAPAAAPAH